jgi:hypothetical protein
MARVPVSYRTPIRWKQGAATNNTFVNPFNNSSLRRAFSQYKDRVRHGALPAELMCRRQRLYVRDGLPRHGRRFCGRVAATRMGAVLRQRPRQIAEGPEQIETVVTDDWAYFSDMRIAAFDQSVWGCLPAVQSLRRQRRSAPVCAGH